MTGATPVWDPYFIETLGGSFSAVSTPLIARVGAFFSNLNSHFSGSKNSEILVKKSVKNISKLTINEKIKVAEEAKKTPDKKKK